jgi:hypothetical protein
MARADRPRPEPIVRTVETSTLLDSGMDVYFPREVTESEEAAETGASPSRHRTSGSQSCIS